MYLFFDTVITDFKTNSATYNTRSKNHFHFFSFLTIPMIIHIDRVLLTSVESKYFLLTYQLVTHYLLMWVYRNAKMNDFQEYFDMLMVLGKCRKHYRNVQYLYAARYPDRQQKSHMAFKQLADRFWRIGTVKQTRVKRQPIVSENNATAISAFAALNPHASSRQMAKKRRIRQ